MNAGFDKDLSSWDTGSSDTWTSADAEGCPFSGSMACSLNDGEPNKIVSVRPNTTYNFGAVFSSDTAGTSYLCEVYGTSASISGTIAVAGSWVSDSGSFTTSADTVTVQLDCELMGAKVDQIYLTPAPGRF